MSQVNDFLDGKQTPSEIDSFLGPDTPKPASAARKLGDLGLSVAKGVIAVPEAAVGLADLVTGGRAGKAAEDMDVRFKDAKDVLSGWQSDDLKGKQQQFQQADGVLDKAGVAVTNPSLIANAVAESAPLMGAGGVGARGVMAALPKAGAVAAGAAGEGLLGAGSAAEQIRQETEDGLLTGAQAALAGASGVATGAFGVAGGKAAKALGIGDVDTMIARGATDVAQTAAQAEKGMLRRGSEGALAEGVLEELPQSLSEQALQNLALDKPLTEGLADAGVMGVLTGGSMGAGAGVLTGRQTPPPPEPVQPAPIAGLLGNTPDPLISFPDGTVGHRADVDAYVAGLPENEQPAARARLIGLAPQPAQAPPSAQMGIDPDAGVLSRVAAQAVDTGTTQEIELNQRMDEEQLAYEQAMGDLEAQRAEQDSVDKPITSGVIAESQMSEEDKRAMLFSNQAVADGGQRHVGTQDGDILNGMGAPFATRLAAARRANMEGKDWTIAPVFDGWVARRKDAFNGQSSGVLPAAAGRSEQGSDQPAPSVGLGATDGNAVGADEAGRADDAVGESRQLPGGDDDAAVGADTNGPLAPVENAQAATEKIANVQDEQAQDGTQAQAAPDQAPAAVEGNAAPAEDLPGAGSSPVEPAGVSGNVLSLADKLDARVRDTAMEKAVRQEFDAQMGSLRELNAQGRVTADDAAVLEGIMRSTDNGWEASRGLHALLLTIKQRPAPGIEQQAQAPAAPVTEPANDSSVPKKAPYASKADLDHLFGVDAKREKAIARIAKGTAYFGTNLKAAQFINDNGLKGTHEVVRHESGANRWDVRAKTEANKAIAPADIAQPATNSVAQPEEMTNGTQAPETQQAEAQGPQERAPGQPVADDKPSLRKAQAKRKAANLAASVGNAQTADAAEFVTAPDGSIDFGEITPEMSKAMRRQAGMIRLTRGVQKEKGGYGLAHIESRHGDQIRGLGYGSVQEFVKEVASNFVEVWQAPGVQLLVTAKDGRKDVMYVQLDIAQEGDYYRVNSAFPVRQKDYEERQGMKLLWPESEPQAKVTGEPSAFVAESANKSSDADPNAATQSAQSVASAAAKVKKPDAKAALSEREKAAKAKMFNALGKLATLAGKNTRMNWTQEEEQQLLPIVIELFDGAMELGAVSFQQAVAYVRDFITTNLDSETADAIPFDTLQGAYISVAGRHKDKAVTSKKEVVGFESLDELQASTPIAKEATSADTDTTEGPNATRELDSAGTGALGGTPAQDVRTPDQSGDTGASADGRGASNIVGNAGSDLTGLPAPGRMGNDAGALPVSAGGTRASAKNAKKPRVSRAPRVDAGDGLFGPAGGITPAAEKNPAPNAPPIAAPQFTAQDFTITDELGLGEGGQKTKFKNNVAAIRLLADLEATGRMATPDEQQVLAKYVGWGGLPQAFDASNADWAKEFAEITALMTPEELASARQSTRYAHFTSKPIIVDGIYAALRRFGFTGGKTLEAGAGVGNFMGLMPADMRSAGRFTAIEREPFSAAIAKHLYPQQNVQRADFTEFKGNDAFYDAAVGNPPFASDPQIDRSGRKHLSGLSLHNYFFAKSVDMLREGGIMAQVVTNAFMDARTDTARKYIADRATLLGAIRLPNSAFAKNANTEVTTDIIFLQKRPDSEIGGKAARADAKRWVDMGTTLDKNGKQIALNRYFIDNPSMMLGEFGAFGTMYGPDFPALVARPGQDTLALLQEAVGKLPEGVYKSIAETGAQSHTSAAVLALSSPPVKEGGYFVENGKLVQRLPDLAGEARGVEITPDTQWTEKTKLGDTGFARIKALADMRGTVRGLIAAEMADKQADMDALRATLNTQYDAYRDTHGLINDPSTLRVFEDDPDFPLLASLEHGYTPGIGVAAAKRMGVKMQKSTAKKGPIFSQRVVAARQQVKKVASAADALDVSMAERGKLDAAYIGQLLGKDADAVLKELSTGDKPLLFRDPATDEYVLRDAYLSGNVRAKLAQAKSAGMFTNVTALERVQPPEVASHEIVARIGSPWVPTSVYEDFAKELYGQDAKVAVGYLKANSSFQLSVYGASDVALTNTWGTKDYPGDALLSAMMNNRSIKVTYKDGEGKTRTDADATERANTKAQEMKDRFADWLFSDADRSELLTKAYNETNNNYVTRVYDGSHMTFPGKVPDAIIKFRRHQRNAIARIVQDRTALLDHVVGAGKTFTVISGAMELKRTGLARKSMIAVPNHLVKQWAADFYRLYPGANILTATKKDFEKSNRRKFLAKIATGDWDAVVIAHSSYGFIKPAPEFEAEFNEKQVANIMATIKELDDGDGDKQTKKRTVKQLEGMKERLENRIRALRDKPMDDLLDFEQIGVDQLFVDEAHLFKNLMFSTKMQQVQGLGDSAGSQRAYDMYVKAHQIYNKNGRGQGVVFATGTPVSNSLAEMYHMMRYLMPDQMKAAGFESFDAWANTFASVDQVWMQAPSGDGFKASNRMSNFVNTTELLKMFDQVSDTVTMEDIQKAYSEENNGAKFPLPKLKGGRRTPVSLDKSKAQDDYMAEVAKRAKAIEARKGPPKKGDDNILVVMGDARKAAMDIRLVDPDVMEREVGGRIDRATDEVVSRYKRYDQVKGTQIVFSDLGTPLKHAKTELKEYEALQARIDGGTEDVQASAALGNEAAMETMEDVEAAMAELDAMGADWLGAVKAALRGFSVYDDFKQALIEKGVPEAEIAFIHDYNTDEQKATLFRKVNAGQIRVLMGSTSKLGAGTNVQERLVAEHHLDVPWRPSDVEQREGRIIRQGNKLMDEVPGFEVEILAYVTKDTLDMRMWQVQETKLKMINQLRTRQISREIDNAFEDMELSAGEMQAAATGDINLLKEIQLRNDVKKLEQKRRSFEAQRNDLITRKKRVAERMQSLPGELAQAERTAAHAQAYQKDLAENAPPFKMEIDGKVYADATEAQIYLRELTDKREPAIGKDGFAMVEDGKPATRAAPISVTINGEVLKNRNTIAELFSEVRGDLEPIKWTVNGTDYRRRTTLANAIRQNVVDAIADEAVKPIGAIGGYDVAVEGGLTKSGGTTIDLTMSRNGKVEMALDFTVGDAGRAPETVIRNAENMIQSAINQASYLKSSLERAKNDAADLEKVQAAGAWPEESKLEAARAAHKEVLGLLKQKEKPADGAPALSRARVKFSRGAQVQANVAVEDIALSIASKWEGSPEIVVAFDMDDPIIPANVRKEDQRQRSGGATGTPEGFYYKGVVYLMSSKLGTPNDVARVLFHEALGHAGLRGAFGGALKPILREVAIMRRGEVEAKLKQYGLKGVSNMDRLIAAEEVLAEMAQARPDIGFVKRAIAAIRTWLRENVKGFNSLRLTDDELIRNYILPARRFVENGGGPKGGVRVASGTMAAAMANQNPAFDNAEALEIQAAVEGKSLQEVAKWIAATGAPDQRLIAGKVLNRINMLQMAGVKFEFHVAHVGDRIPAQLSDSLGLSLYRFAPNDSSIKVWVNGADVTGKVGVTREVILHELVHAVTMGAVRLGNMRGAAGSKLAQDVSDLYDVSSAIIKHFNSRSKDIQAGRIAATTFERQMLQGRNNAFVNPNETLAWALTDKEAQAYLETIPYKGKSAWTAFVEAVRKFLGLSATADTALSEVLRVAESLMGDNINQMVQMARISGTALAVQTPMYEQTTAMQADAETPVFSRTLGETLSTAANNVHDVSLPAGYTVGDLLKSAPGKVGWWHKTVGTMYNLAQRSPEFKRVFDGVQTFINDVSYYATEAADLAPTILPKLETWKDITKSPLSAEDTKAISAPIFEGTLTWARDEAGKPIQIDALEAQAATLTPEQKAQRLLRNDKVSDQVLKMWQGLPIDQYEAIINGKYERDMLKAGVVWTDAELRDMFDLTAKQIPLYREFRKATDKSLTNLAISDMLRFGGKDVQGVREMALSSSNAMQAGVMLRDYLLSLAEAEPGRASVLVDTANKMIEKADKAQDLIARGYAPLSRYGQYTLDVVDADGERVYFGMFESKIDASRMARKLEQEYAGATITRGTVSEEEYKLFAGVSPETLELFGDMLGLEANGDSAASKAFQTYLKLAKSNRSSMKRMIQRKGIAGFSEDSGRVLAGFVYSNARQTASNLHMGEMTDAANEVAKTQGELKDQAVRLVDYVKNPREEAQAFRGLLFAQYIGGSVASAMVNMTQPITMTFPWLAQYGGAAGAAKQIGAAMKDANKKLTGDDRLDAALKRAEEDGTVSPQEVHQLMQQSQGRGALQSGDGTRAGDALATANNALSRFSLGWGKLFSLAEQFNRRATFIAAYRTAIAQGIDAPEAFARKAIAETQGIYNKGNKPAWARGAVGSTLFTFKQYSIAYVEMLHRMATRGGPEGKKAALLALGVLFLMSGAGGMPGGDDLDDLISGIMQRLGYNFDSKAKRQEFFAGLVGEGGAQFLERGVSGLPGVPIDLSGRLGMGNLIPGTGLLVKKVDHTRDLAEIAGPGGDFVKRGFDAAGKVLDGNVFGANGAAATVAPKAIQNLYQSYDMASMGMYRDAKGMKVLDTDGYDTAMKAIGFQPNDVKKVQDASFEAQRMIGLNKMRETEIANRWALGIFEKDTDKVKAAREELAQWNATNPESPIRINFKQILQRVQKMNQSKAERITATAPKEIRADVRRALDTQ